MSAHSTNFGEAHLASERHVAYYGARARGGAALLFTEAVRVHPTSLEGPATLAGYLPSSIPCFARVVTEVHRHGAKMFAQLVHMGRHGSTKPVLWAPSALPWCAGAPVPHAMSRAEISEVVDAFALSARHVVEAGFDGMEIHLGHGHLLQQFLSPVSNMRTDEYGGSEDNRLRVSLEVLCAVRRSIGSDCALGVRISGDEFLDDGLDVEDMARITQRLTNTVALDFINVSHSHYCAAPSLASQIADMSFPSGAFLSLPARIKAAAGSLTVLAACRIDDVRLGEAALEAGTLDMVGMTRAHIADPELVTKARAGRLEEIRPCLYCNQGCIAQIENGRPLSCVVNPEVGFEREWDSRARDATVAPRRVLVVGGGPAGLSAARSAGRRGHHVELWERSDRLGGQLFGASLLANRGRLALLFDFLTRELGRLRLDVRLGKTANASSVREGGFDHVVVATGCRWTAAERAALPSVSPLEAIASPDVLGSEVVVVDSDGSWLAFGLLEHLASSGRRTHLVTPLAALAPQVSLYSRLALLDRLKRRGRARRRDQRRA